MFERSKQALVKMAIEPEWEAVFEKNSYGFRPGRSCQDAIAAIFNHIKSKAKFVLDADIKGCFDNIQSTGTIEEIANICRIETDYQRMAQGRCIG